MEIEWFRSRREDTGELVDVPVPPQSRWYQVSKQVQFLVRYFNHGSEETQMCFDALLGFQGRHGEWFELGDSEVNRFMAEEIK